MAKSGSTAALSMRLCLAEVWVRRHTLRATSTSSARTKSTSTCSATGSDGRASAASDSGDASPDECAFGDSISVGPHDTEQVCLQEERADVEVAMGQGGERSRSHE